MYELIRLEWPKQQTAQSHQDTAKLFEAIVPSEFQCCLQGKDPHNISDTSIIAIGAIQNGLPIGIALATLFHHIHQVKLHYFFVLPEYCNQHLGRNILNQLEDVGKEEGGRFFIFNYKLEDPFTLNLEKILAACGWKPAKTFMIECLYNSFTFNPPWIHIPYKLPMSLEEFAWSELTAADKAQIINDQRRGIIPLHVDPFRKESLIEPLNSLGLRHDGRVIGWMITHRVAPDKIIYHALYIERSFHFMGPGAKLLIDSMLMQKTLPIKWAAFELPLIQVQPAWVQFINKRLVPYADQVIHHVQSWK